MGFEQAGLVQGVPAPWQGVGTKGYLTPLPTQTSLGFYDIRYQNKYPK